MKGSRNLQRRFVVYVVFILLFVLLAARIYMLGMEHLEQSPRGFWRSLEVVFESLTSTGYGADSNWSHPLMNLYMIVLQISGLGLLFLMFPLYLLPFFESRFAQRLPSEADGMDGHVLIYRHSHAVASVIGELEKEGQPVLVVEEDEQEARRLMELGHEVIQRGLDDESLLAAGLLRARTLIANGGDAENVTLALSARQLGFTGSILSFVADPTFVEVMSIAGCDEVLAPRHLLSVALAARASEKVSPTLAGAHQLGQSLEVFQIRVHRDSRLAGLDLRQAAIGAKTGVVVIGQWVGGALISSPGPEMILEPGGILVVAGARANIEKLIRLEAGTRPVSTKGPFVVVGHGEVGTQVAELLRESGEHVLAVDRKESPEVDIAGDIMSPELISALSLEVAQGIILALDSDVTTLFATVFLRDRCHGVPILARVNEAENLEKIHRAGADFALSFSQVAANLLVGKLLGRQTLELDPQLKLLKVDGEILAGKHPSELAIRAETGCSFIGVERDEKLLTDFDPDFLFSAGDEVFVCGSKQAVERFEKSRNLR